MKSLKRWLTEPKHVPVWWLLVTILAFVPFVLGLKSIWATASAGRDDVAIPVVILFLAVFCLVLWTMIAMRQEHPEKVEAAGSRAR